jgi:branched-chain amino acid transport system ATP-binding protein
MSTTAQPLLQVHDLNHSFSGLHVLKGVNFDVALGKFVGLIGPNGAGKSTLFNIVSGFLRANHGSILYDGQEISSKSVQQRSRRGLIRTFQTPKVFAKMTVLENLLVGSHKDAHTGVVANLLRTKRSRREYQQALEAANQAAKRFGLDQVRDALAGNLPGGKQRMLELARAHIARPKLLMLDEPSSGLSGEEISELRSSLHALNGDGITILLVSHDMNLVANAELIHVLCFGEIIASGAMSQIQLDPRVREAYLGA